jgi:hypothetical protein
MQIHELTQLKENQINEIDLVGPNSIFNKARAATTAIKSGGGKFKDPNNTYQQALNQQYQQAAAKAAAGLKAQGYSAAPPPAPVSTTTTPQAPAEPMKIGGQTLDPNNPAHAQIIAQAQAAQQQQAPAQPSAATTPQAPVTPAPAVATRPNTAGAVQTGGAQAIMTQTELNTALRQANLSRNQIDELAKQLQATPGMAQALLKALGLAK